MKRIALLCMLILMQTQLIFSQTDTTGMSGFTNTSQFYDADLIQGLEAYRAENWADALFFLRKTASFSDTPSDDVWYLMIMAEMNLHNYTAVLRDGEEFINRFTNSLYVPDIAYQTILARFGLQMYDEAILGFTTFIEQYPTHSLVSSALFWTAESLYQSYEFERSLALYERLVAEYPDSPKYTDSIFRIELLMQRAREEKLRYLLRVTGEEALAAKEDYERQIKQLQSEESINLRKKLQELEYQQMEIQAALEESTLQNANLENRIIELLYLNEQLRSSRAAVTTDSEQNSSLGTSTIPQTAVSADDDKNLLIAELTRKANHLQALLDEQEKN